MSQTKSPTENRSDRVPDEQPVLGDHRTRYVRNHIGVLSELVDLFNRGETWTVADVPEELAPNRAALIRELYQHNIIRVVGWDNDDRCSGDEERAVWELSPRARAGIIYWRRHIRTWPCGHAATGFRNLADEPGYTCVREGCDIRFGREVVETQFR
jgi:hypothetical protein